VFEQNRSLVRAFTGSGAEQRAERVGHWFKALAGVETSRNWCVKQRIALTKAANESGNAAGGYLAPIDFDNAVISVREALGAFRQGAEIRPAGSDNQVRPRRFGGVTAAFVLEGAAIPESSFQLDAVGTTQRKLATLSRASAELFEDDAAGLAEFLASEIGYAFVGVEDDCGFNGDGTSTYTGIMGLANKLTGTKSSVAAASGHNTFLTIDSTDIANLMANVMAAALPGAAWYTTITGFAQTFCRLSAVSGGLTAVLRSDGRIDANFLGFPVRFSAKLHDETTSLAGKPMLFFGDLRMSSVIVERHQQTVFAVSRDRALEQDQVLIRGVRRLDIVNHSVGDASTRGPVAVLVGTT
jgi:HK97 family phage major capsid protein